MVVKDSFFGTMPNSCKQLTHYNGDYSGPSKHRKGCKAVLQDGIVFQKLSLNPEYLVGLFYTSAFKELLNPLHF